MGSKEDTVKSSEEQTAAIKAAKKLLKKNSSSSPTKLKQLVKEVVAKVDGDDDDAKSIKKWIKKSDKFDVSECGKYVSLAGSGKAKGSGDKKESKKRKRDADDHGKKSAKEKSYRNQVEYKLRFYGRIADFISRVKVLYDPQQQSPHPKLL